MKFLAAPITLVLFLAGTQALWAEDVERWGMFEVSLNGPSTNNPFTDVTLSARFEKDGRSFTPEGFYNGNGVYKIRFMPDETGTWSYTTTSNQAELNGKTGSFTCTPATLTLPAGKTYNVDILDGWAMTITPQGTHSGTFTLQLPGKEFIAVRAYTGTPTGVSTPGSVRAAARSAASPLFHGAPTCDLTGRKLGAARHGAPAVLLRQGAHGRAVRIVNPEPGLRSVE